MALILRGFWDDPWEGLTQPSRLFDQRFGNPVSDEHFLLPHRFSRGLRQAPLETGLSEVVNNDKEFRVNLDCRDFKPEEIEIKTKDNRLVIHAKHEEKQDEHGYIMREFTRNYVLPKDVDPEAVKSSLNDDGVLTLEAPKKALEPPKERAIPITHEKGDS
ncbi:alpha-crystallin B chain-like [Littorina saxatilis]|uniref:SHSP domain-containing protein n=1 Tax=Littorina saxatilis TaxID=31220 RepID=A0AAN9BT14_9CAEN